MGKQRFHEGYDFRGAGYTTRRGLRRYNEMHQIDFSKLIKGAGLEEGTVVDLGCGNGIFLSDLLRIFPKLKVVGADKKLYKHALPQFVQTDLTSIGLGRNLADLVVSSGVSQWIGKKQSLSLVEREEMKRKFYREIFRILRPSGYGFVFPFNPAHLPSKIPGDINHFLRTLKKGPAKQEVGQLVLGKLTEEDLNDYRS